MAHVLLKFNQNRPKKIQFSSRLEKSQEKRPNGNPVQKWYGSRPTLKVPQFDIFDHLFVYL
jgi:hypothetical protein